MNDLTVSGAKALARGIVERMTALGVTMSLAQALEAVAASYHYSDWNRFLDALKKGRLQSSSGYHDVKQPHRLIATAPDKGANLVLEHEFEYQRNKPDQYPILIELGGFAPLGAYFPRFQLEEAGLYAAYIEATDSFKIINKVHLGKSSGVVIYLCEYAEPNNAPKMLSKEKMQKAWKALLAQLGTWFTPQQLDMPGMLAVRGYEVVDSGKSADFDVTFPALTSAQGPFRNKSLLVLTQTDRARQGLYRSPDAWRVIMMAGDEPKLFYRCPFEKVCVYPFAEPAQSFYPRLFADPRRRLEDAALFVGQLSSAALATKLPHESEYGQSLIEYMVAREAWMRRDGAWGCRDPKSHLHEV
ncbi:glyoxalase superfamily protein [Pseudomonas taiwanensis]|uniref:glyoxalase superfamily protein n=1 Tax=Pseudomonas taiwanensis TaxID=470150 RepID=UPI0028DE6734|nr:glyoxalase superfamily protein [Pseudomonas taiwanensis]MDT8925512.1 glyoxalase superfamily protein [Pseudomonas taiwanensis]